MKINYKTDQKVSVEEYRQVLILSTLAERRPIDDLPKLKKMLENTDVLITAWDDVKLIGVARTITDFAICSYLADLAVIEKYQKLGIGKKLIEITENLIGRDVMLFLISAPNAIDYYPKVGFEKMSRSFVKFPEIE